MFNLEEEYNKVLNIMNERMSNSDKLSFAILLIASVAYLFNKKILGHNPSGINEWLFMIAFIIAAVLLFLFSLVIIDKVSNKFNSYASHWVRVVLAILILPTSAWIYSVVFVNAVSFFMLVN